MTHLLNLYKLYAVRWSVSITVEGIQCGISIPSVGEVYSVRMSHTVSTVEAHSHYGGGYAVRTCHTISTDVSHLQYSGGCEVRTCHVISTVEGVQYRTTKTAQGVVGGCIKADQKTSGAL